MWTEQALDGTDEDDRPDLDEPDRWLFLPGGSSRVRWRDRLAFAESQTGPVRLRLLGALDGRGAFARFSRVLDREPDLLDDWRVYAAERERGRARAVLAEAGLQALPPTP